MLMFRSTTNCIKLDAGSVLLLFGFLFVCFLNRLYIKPAKQIKKIFSQFQLEPYGDILDIQKLQYSNIRRCSSVSGALPPSAGQRGSNLQILLDFQRPSFEFNSFILSLLFKLVPFAFLSSLLFSTSLSEGKHQNKPSFNGLLSSAAAENTLYFFYRLPPTVQSVSRSLTSTLNNASSLRAGPHSRNTTMGRHDLLPL